MNSTRRLSPVGLIAASVLLIPGLYPSASAQPPAAMPSAGRTVLTSINRLLINPPQVVAFGYFPTIEGLPGPLFSGTPNENTAYFTWSLNAAGAAQLTNGDPMAAGGAGVAVLPSDETFNVYYNATPNQNWSDPASFSAGQLIATLKSTTGTQTGAGPVAFVTQSYVLASSSDFTFKGQTYNLSRLIPHGFTMLALSSNIPMNGATAPPLTFTAAGSGVAIGGAFSALPWWY